MDYNLAPSVPAISPEELSQKRLDQLANVAESLHQEMPEFLGMTAFGSVVRGAAHEGSDVDICVFMELTDSHSSPQDNPHVSPEEKVRPSSDLPSTYEFHPAINLDYKAAIISHLPEQEIVEPDIIVLPMTSDLVDTLTDVLLENAKDAAKATKSNSVTIDVPRNIYCLFNAPVDTELLKPYIKQVLTKLTDNELGTVAWRMIRHMVIRYEQGRQGNFEESPHRTIPETLTEALAHYQVETAEPTRR